MSFHIVQVVNEFSTEGGAETVAWELARAWDRAGIPNMVIAASTKMDGNSRQRVQLVVPWLARIPTRGIFRHTGRLLVVPIFTFAATLALRRHQDAAILSHGDALTGDALVVHAVNVASLAQKSKAGQWTWRLNPMHIWVNLRDWWMIGGLRYRKYIAVSPRVVTELQAHYHVPADRICVIPNGIDFDRFKPDPAAGRAIRREFSIPEKARLLLFVSHEFERKGLAYAIGALKKLPSDTWLVVVGSDNPVPYRRLAGDVQDRVVFAGGRKDVPAFYSAADAFVLPTAYETFSLVCMEAMASGIPVFATRVGGIEDYLEDGVNGYAISRDAGVIAAALGPVLRDDARLARLAEGARATARRFDWDGVAARYATLLRVIWQEKCDVLGVAQVVDWLS